MTVTVAVKAPSGRVFLFTDSYISSDGSSYDRLDTPKVVRPNKKTYLGYAGTTDTVAHAAELVRINLKTQKEEYLLSGKFQLNVHHHAKVKGLAYPFAETEFLLVYRQEIYNLCGSLTPHKLSGMYAAIGAGRDFMLSMLDYGYNEHWTDEELLEEVSLMMHLTCARCETVCAPIHVIETK